MMERYILLGSPGIQYDGPLFLLRDDDKKKEDGKEKFSAGLRPTPAGVKRGWTARYTMVPYILYYICNMQVIDRSYR